MISNTISTAIPRIDKIVIINNYLMNNKKNPMSKQVIKPHMHEQQHQK